MLKAATQILALMVLGSLATFGFVVLAVDGSPCEIPRYNRSEWGSWIDVDGDCQNTRAEVLLRDSRAPVTLNPAGCTVRYGWWLDRYDGAIVESAGGVEIDHIVAVAEAHRSGGWRWSAERKRGFFNDPANLTAVGRRSNRQKSDRDPSGWRPPRYESRCWYGRKVLEIKAAYQLDFDAAEVKALVEMLATCEGDR